MAKVQENFIKGRMNKSVDERLIPDGEYIDAQNVRLGSTEESEIGSVENTKGNFELTNNSILYNGQALSSQAATIGAVADGIHETIYWFVHDPAFSIGATGKLDLILSYNTKENQLTYHVVSIDDGGGENTTLNFSRNYLVTGVDVLDDFLFFTDGLNPPRKINIKRNYPDPDPVLNVDGISAEELMVIKKPPITSPPIEVKTTTADNNFLEERFVSFAYRYKYEDNEYSATSQFSEPAFIPKNFNFNTKTYLNDGMVNLGNECVITYNTGGRLVKEVELLFKEMGDSTIKVIEKLNKEELGLADDTDYTFSFDNSKIYTILDDAEILRLYDNVPHTAVAQTIMGNRLMYGNYTDGYDIVDAGGNKVKLEYSANLISEEIGSEVIADGAGSNTESSNYTYGATVTVEGSQFFIDLADINLKQGAVLSFYLRFAHNKFEGDTTPTETTADQEITLEYILKKDYDNAYELATDPDFIQSIGVVDLLTSGTNTSVTATSLVDSGATFITDGVKEGSLVTNTSTNTSSVVSSVVSETQLTLVDDIFTATPENYSIYTATSIRAVEDACSGVSLTDRFNCTIPNNLDSLTKVESGIASAPQPIAIKASSSSSIIRFQLPAVRFVDNVATPTQNAYEYYEINDLLVDYREIGNPTSLHSNRDYQIGIIYMDEFNRASTALVSTNNTVHVPCSASDLRNQIQVTIPTQQIAPSWATRYKFAIKADRDQYETIYSNIYYEDVTDNSVYFLLEGENARKVEVGDRYYVKADTDGAVNNCVLATVLEKEAKPSDFLSPAPQDANGNDLPVIGGVYMKMKPDNFNAIFDPDAIVSPGIESRRERTKGDSPVVLYPANIETDTTNNYYKDYNIPPNSRVKLRFETFKEGNTLWRGDEFKRVEYKSEIEIVSSAEYNNLKEFFDSENVAGALNAAAFVDTDGVCSDGAEIVYLDTLLTPADVDPPTITTTSQCDFYIQFYRYDPDPSAPTGEDDGQLILMFSGTTSGGSGKRVRSTATVEIQVVRAESTVVFETEPQETAPDVWYESSDSFPITTNGYHEGNVQNQTAGQAGIVTTDFFNCISFGNGVESSKIYDSLTGKSLFLGNRITTVANQDFKRAERYSDITYSGVYNDESNINKLNSFNLGQLNFKVLEDTYGPVMVMSGRKTDVLVLQEDKISYVLAGKNLISDSSAGGAITSVPEVLGTQIARVEEYGISHNPESYAEWGAMKYFTDAKRGAVIQLFGSSSQNEQLSVISNAGMRSWFRDMFIEEFNTQKLGAYDPYMGEYVLATTSTTIPQPVEILNCGVTKTYDVFQGSAVDFNVNVGKTVGDVVVDYNIIAAAGDVRINATYNGVVVSSGFVNTSGSITVDKDTVSKDTLNINMVSNNGLAVVELKVNCPDARQITIYEIAITSNGNEGEFITNQYRWTDGGFVSPLHSERMEFATGLVSKYDAITGPQGAGIIPANGASVDIISKRIEPVDNYQFDVAVDKFFFLRSDTLYENNTTDINALLAAATEVAPSAVDANTFSGSFTMPDTTEQYLYIIYDYRNGSEQSLCFGTSRFDVCCNCT